MAEKIDGVGGELVAEEGDPVLLPPQRSAQGRWWAAGGACGTRPTKFANWKAKDFKEAGFRAVPGAIVRRSAYIAPGVVLMPSFVNLGVRFFIAAAWSIPGRRSGHARKSARTCISPQGAGIGVLEPLQANPVIIEDNCFIGARAEVAEGVIVGEGSVLSMGVDLASRPENLVQPYHRRSDARPRAAFFRWWCRAPCQANCCRMARLGCCFIAP